MRMLNIVFASSVFISVNSVAHTQFQIEKETPSAEKVKFEPIKKVENDLFFIQSTIGLEQATSLKKGQYIMSHSGQSLGKLTGKFFVKLRDGVSVEQFLQTHPMNLEWKSSKNLLLLSPQNDDDLLKILNRLKNDPLIKRARLDRLYKKHETM